jgi:hypothetical protein
VTGVHNFEFIREHFKGIGKDSRILSWLVSNNELFYQISFFFFAKLTIGFLCHIQLYGHIKNAFFLGSVLKDGVGLCVVWGRFVQTLPQTESD